MNNVEYFTEKYLDEYDEMKLVGQERYWLKKFLERHFKLVDEYEAVSSNMTSDAAEIIGEMRERRFTLKLINEISEDRPPCCTKLCKDIADAIDNSEHY